ncbi:hypothetical protein LSTR_LSTR003797 [Laodelphax striatellus]|uniref:Uncharacterized protein n=1 Tax=Laodelphax striatellus TaxID=195883 RepID=A0A482XEM4_LAOST|nr:hypothetical protein LSTR_LSTR003797 [Laodelphax striatellus]
MSVRVNDSGKWIRAYKRQSVPYWLAPPPTLARQGARNVGPPAQSVKPPRHGTQLQVRGPIPSYQSSVGYAFIIAVTSPTHLQCHASLVNRTGNYAEIFNEVLEGNPSEQ